MLKPVRLMYLLCLFIPLKATALEQADTGREVFEMELKANIEDVWHAFTTTEGLRLWVAPLADIDFKVGGKWRANYNAKGKLGDETTIENTILSYDHQHMLSLKASRFPKNFPFVEAARDTWSVFYFEPLSKLKTKITVVGLGYTDTEQSQKMRSFFADANRYSLQQLEKALISQRSKVKK